MLGLRSVPTSHTQAQYRTRPSLLHGIQTEVVANASLLPLMELEPNWNWNAFRGRIGVSIVRQQWSSSATSSLSSSGP
jgi:hypothetical protein